MSADEKPPIWFNKTPSADVSPSSEAEQAVQARLRATHKLTQQFDEAPAVLVRRKNAFQSPALLKFIEMVRPLTLEKWASLAVLSIFRQYLSTATYTLMSHFRLPAIPYYA
ncbi:hypothetical protein [Alicyclobacillus sp. SO9]|uniref:hypothetical protein n=1 Tax=Alicyclobacillus sp. SO9 TaxID=2665646 RepID=UPI0018E8D452|nr:hypothetical protein [Alicyclobacillus sp. SO9]